MVSTHKLNRLFQRTDNARSNSAVQGGSPGVPNPPWVAPPAGQSADRLGYDGAGRMIAKRYIASYGSPSAIVGFTTTFDRASNKLYERALHAENRSHLYEPYDAVSNLPTGGYDSLDRVLQYQRGTLSSTGGDGGNGGGSIAVSGSTTQYIHLPGTDLQRSYALDSLGNWRNTVFTPSTTGTPTAQTEIRQHNLLNEITRTSNPAATPMTINATYDLNGNLTSVGTPAFTWDALNRLATASPGGEYYYDALNRRVSKTVSDVQTDFIYSGWRCVEDRNPAAEGGDGPIAQYVWGRYLDELLQITTLVSITTGMGDGTTTYSPGTYFPLQDLLYRTTATVTISEDGVTIVEAYDFDAYGKTLIFNAPGTGSNWWGADVQVSPNSLCQFLFTGQRLDAETGLHFYKLRYYAALLGRFISGDPRRATNEARSYRYVGDSSPNAIDALGLQTQRHHWFPQNRDMVNALDEKCGALFAKLFSGMKSIEFVHLFTTPFTPGSGVGSMHDWIHYRNPKGKWLDLVDDLYNEKNCCEIMKQMPYLMFDVYVDAARALMLKPGVCGPEQFPELTQYRNNTFTSKQLRDLLFNMEKLICDEESKPKSPKPDPVCDPVRPIPPILPLGIPINTAAAADAAGTLEAATATAEVATTTVEGVAVAEEAVAGGITLWEALLALGAGLL